MVGPWKARLVARVLFAVACKRSLAWKAGYRAPVVGRSLECWIRERYAVSRVPPAAALPFECRMARDARAPLVLFARWTGCYWQPSMAPWFSRSAGSVGLSLVGGSFGLRVSACFHRWNVE